MYAHERMEIGLKWNNTFKWFYFVSGVIQAQTLSSHATFILPKSAPLIQSIFETRMQIKFLKFENNCLISIVIRTETKCTSTA